MCDTHWYSMYYFVALNSDLFLECSYHALLLCYRISKNIYTVLQLLSNFNKKRNEHSYIFVCLIKQRNKTLLKVSTDESDKFTRLKANKQSYRSQSSCCRFRLPGFLKLFFKHFNRILRTVFVAYILKTCFCNAPYTTNTILVALLYSMCQSTNAHHRQKLHKS